MFSRQTLEMLRKVPSKSLLRNIHTTTSKPNPSQLLSNAGIQYQALGVNGLKAELRKRGLPLSGRKAQLVERLVTADAQARRPLSTTPAVQAKGDDSHIDYFLVPDKKPGPQKSKVTIPIVPDNRTVAKEVVVEEPVAATPDAASASSAVHSVSGDRVISSMNTDLGDAAAEEVHDEEPGTKLPARDKTILAGIVAGVAALWSGDALWNSKKH